MGPCCHYQPICGPSTGLTQTNQASPWLHIFSNIKQIWFGPCCLLHWKFSSPPCRRSGQCSDMRGIKSYLPSQISQLTSVSSTPKGLSSCVSCVCCRAVWSQARLVLLWPLLWIAVSLIWESHTKIKMSNWIFWEKSKLCNCLMQNYLYLAEEGCTEGVMVPMQQSVILMPAEGSIPPLCWQKNPVEDGRSGQMIS